MPASKSSGMTNLLRRLVLVLAILAIAAPATAAEDAPVFVREEAWIHATDTRITNIDAAQGTLPSWDATKPTASQPYGAGGIYLANNLSPTMARPDHEPAMHFTTQGTFTGELDTMAVTLFAQLPWMRALPCGIDLAFDLQIDGVTILEQAYNEASTGIMVNQVEDDLYNVRFAFTRLDDAMAEYGVATGPDVEHAITMNVQNFYLCQEAVWVYDSAEAPAGMVFNGTAKELKSYTEIDVFNPPPPIES